MIGILDPALFLMERPGALQPGEDQALDRLLRDVARVCRDYALRFPTPKSYAERLKRELLVPLQRATRERTLLQSLDFFRDVLRPERLVTGAELEAWGLRELFAGLRLGDGWLGEMERVVAMNIGAGEPIVLLTRFFEGRNLRRHAVDRCELLEKTRWRVRTRIRGGALVDMPCVRNVRNMQLTWTVRYDERLPAVEDDARYPFCPPEQWCSDEPRGVRAWRTHLGKPAWIDGHGNAWVRPSTGGGHHWDVFVHSVDVRQKLGLDQLNIVEFGAPDREGKAGHVHHVPTDKQSRFRDRGWSC